MMERSLSEAFIPAPLGALYAPLLDAESFVIGQVGQSLDGRVATAAGDARKISGLEGLRHLHRLRALADAVIIGAGTVLHDDPQLTVREVSGRNPARVIIDPNGRVTPEARVFTEDGTRRIVVQAASHSRRPGVECVTLDVAEGGLCARTIIAELAARGLRKILVEGGAKTLQPFLVAGALDRLHITISPLIIGAGPAGLCLPAVDGLSDCLHPRTRFFDLGGEIVADCVFEPQAGSASRS